MQTVVESICSAQFVWVLLPREPYSFLRRSSGCCIAGDVHGPSQGCGAGCVMEIAVYCAYFIQGFPDNMTPDDMTIALYDSFWLPKRIFLYKKSSYNMKKVNMTLLPIPKGIILTGENCIRFVFYNVYSCAFPR